MGPRGWGDPYEYVTDRLYGFMSKRDRGVCRVSSCVLARAALVQWSGLRQLWGVIALAKGSHRLFLCC